MAQVFLDILYSFGNCLNCFPGSPTLKINSRSFKILRLLGEGGFSYVYLVQDTSTSELFALKKIRCPFGAESVAQAMREVEAYKLFAHTPGIIHSVDHAVASDRGAGVSGIGSASGADEGKVVYVLLPYYRRGNLQDIINANTINHAKFPERKLMELFLGVCTALKSMHQYRGQGPERMMVDDSVAGVGKKKGKKAIARQQQQNEEDESDQERPLMDGQDTGLSSGPGGKVRSYAHRDIKPGNIMISDDGTSPILMDLGSIATSPIPITSRSLAIATQDTAAEHSTMPYRAPELFDVKTGTIIDTKVDIWSLGCTLYACLVGKSPFEARSDETGGSLSLCIMGGDWRFPGEGNPGGVKRSGTGMTASKGKAPAGGAGGTNDVGISEPIREIVRKCLAVEPNERPDIDELIDMVEAVVDKLPEDGAA